MDYYLNENHVYDRLKNEYKKYGKIIISYDFDGTIFDFHNQGFTYDNVINLLKRFKNYAYFIVYTASKKSRFKIIREYLDENSIPYDTINKNIETLNIPQEGKLYYNILLDDRAGLKESYYLLLRLINEIEGGII